MSTRAASTSGRWQVPVFFVLAFALSWLVWGSKIAQQHGWIGFHIPETFAYIGVSLAAFIVAGIVSGRVGLLDLLRRMVRWRTAPGWYGIALLLPVAFSLLAAGIARLLGAEVHFGADISLVGALVYVVYGLGLWLVTEETAWRGFALPRMQANGSSLRAAIILGVIWGVWHTPMFLIADSSQANMPYIPFVLLTVAESIVIAWIFNSTGGSTLLAALFHAASDAALVYTGVVAGAMTPFLVTTVVLWAIAALVVWRAGAPRLSRTGAEAQAVVGAPH